MDAQMKKGVLELCLLCFINNKDRYGYELVEIASKHIELTDNTVYPILRRLTEKKLLTTYLVESDAGGPARKYYQITQQGKEELNHSVSNWEKFVRIINGIIKESGVNYEK